MTDKFKKEMESEGYYGLKEIPGRGVCAVRNMLFTVGLFYGLDEDQYEGRYCFPSVFEAVIALLTWDGKGDPDGPWIKHKGYVEYSNPKNNKDGFQTERSRK